MRLQVYILHFLFYEILYCLIVMDNLVLKYTNRFKLEQVLNQTNIQIEVVGNRPDILTGPMV